MKNALIVAALLWLPACSPEVPAAPTYAKDVQPILAAHCVRCHGANDMLNALPEAQNLHAPMPLVCYLQRLADEGDCTTATNPTCKRGAGYCATMIPTRLTLPDSHIQRMPPAPSDPLNDWEKDVLTRWATPNPLP